MIVQERNLYNMDSEKDQEIFTYTYSAVQQAELNRIREKYIPPKEDKMEQLRKLDAGVTKKGMTISLTNGIIGTLLMGIGMCCAMIGKESWFIPGIIIGIIGIAFVTSGYPLYGYVIKSEQIKIAPEILKLADELTK